MKTFHDNTGRPWHIEMTIGAIKRVQQLVPAVNLLDPQEAAADERRRDRRGRPLPLLTRLSTDDVLLIDVIFALVKPQADELGVNDEAFARAIGGQAALDAYRAFLAEWADFCRGRGRWDDARSLEEMPVLLETESRERERLVDLASQRLAQHLAGKRQRIAEKLRRGLGTTSGSSPESSASPSETSTS